MAIGFAHPELAGLALLALLPLAIHLFNRQRARPQPFGALEFLLRAQRKTARSLRLRRVLLFCARTALLLAVPLALARPHFAQSAASARAAGPAATAIALDTSLSMRAVERGQSRFDRARALALDALRALPIGDPVTIVDCARGADVPPPPSFDREALLRQLEAAAPTFEAEDLTACLQRAARALAESALPAKRILFATDLAQAGFDLGAPAPAVQLPDGTAARPELILLDAADGAEPPANAAITALEIEPVPALGRRTYRFSISVRNNAGAPLSDLSVRLRIGDEVVAKGFLDIPPRQAAVQILTHRFAESGPVAGRAEIGADALDADNAHHFTLDVPRNVRALIVNGSPHPNRFLDEAFFVQAALAAPGSPVHAVLRDAAALGTEAFAAFDVVLLLNVRELSQAQVASLAAFVEAGGGLFIGLGDQIDADLFNERFGALLPRQLRLLKTAVRSPAQQRERRAARLSTLDLAHPALEPFVADAGESLLSAHFSRYFLLEAEGRADSRTLASFDDGAPALVERKLGKGRVMLFTSALDRAWSDLPIRAGFLPLMQRLMGFLSRTLEVAHGEALRVGEVKAFQMPFARSLREVVSPDGEHFALEVPAEASAGQRFAATGTPGIYAVSGMKQGTRARLPHFDFAVNVDPAEGDLTRLEVDAFRAWFGKESVTRRTSEGGTDAGGARWPLWSLLLAAALLSFIAESLLLRR